MNTHKTINNYSKHAAILALLLLASLSQPVLAISIPDDPRQSIVYWKPHIISSDNADVENVQKIFSVLLRTWDNSRIAPSVHVVKSSTGPWAASLADGNILISMDAVKTCLQFGPNRAKHLLAFVLSHELAHQRSDDLWHQKFFRLIGNQSADKQKQMLRGIDKQWLNDIEKKEAQADHDGLIMMSSVGYDPYQVISDNDFFTTWVEQLWQNSCDKISSSHPAKPACNKAQTRRLRAHAQLEAIASQTTIYALALQAFVAGNLVQARNLLKVYGRELPSRAVYTSIGLTYLTEAIALKNSPVYIQASGTIPFYYPILLDTRPSANQIDTLNGSIKRGNKQYLKQQSARIRKLTADAIHYFERAIKLEPENQFAYLLLSFSYLVDNNTFMARGILQGKYKPLFGDDSALQLVIAMTLAIEGDIKGSIKRLQSLRNISSNTSLSITALPTELLQYTIHYNLAQLYKRNKTPKKVRALWQSLARRAKQSGDTLLFRMALSQLNTVATRATQLAQHPQILSHRLGDKLDIASTLNNKQKHNITNTDIWIEGEKLVLYRIAENGTRFIVNDKNKIINAWQQWSNQATIGRLSVGDSPQRAHKIFGIPNREIFFTRGTYLAYDSFGFGVHIVDNRVAGWFLYDKFSNPQ